MLMSVMEKGCLRGYSLPYGVYGKVGPKTPKAAGHSDTCYESQHTRGRGKWLSESEASLVCLHKEFQASQACTVGPCLKQTRNTE